MSPARVAEPGIAPVVWHDIECGAYAADLPLWRELAARAAVPGRPREVLDLGCGTGRVSLDLAALGHRVTGLDRDPRFVAELEARAAARGVPAGAVTGDVRSFDLGRRFDLVLAAMQILQLLEGPRERIAALECARAHLGRDGLFAAALFDLEDEVTDAGYVAPLPDMRETGGWVWSSQPVALRVVEDGSVLLLERRRRAVSPRGELVESDDSVRLALLSSDELEEELQAAGLVPVERRVIGPTDLYVGSAVVLAKAGDA